MPAFENPYFDQPDDDSLDNDLTEEELVEDFLEEIAIEEYRQDKPWLDAEDILRHHEVFYGPRSDEYTARLWDQIWHATDEVDPPEPPADA